MESENQLETVEHNGAVQTRLISCDYYAVDKYEMDGISVSDFRDMLFIDVSVIEGEGTVDGQPAKMGDHLTLPYHYGACE